MTRGFWGSPRVVNDQCLFIPEQLALETLASRCSLQDFCEWARTMPYLPLEGREFRLTPLSITSPSGLTVTYRERHKSKLKRRGMTITLHARYFAHELTRRRQPEGVDRLSMALFDACVDLNPHQIEAALFALRSPLSKGVILADEVGLGKTIEAGLVLCQNWAERKRRLLVICPASLRKQWSLEIQEKFNLPTVILDARSYRLAQRGNPQPFRAEAVVIVSLHYASKMRAELGQFRGTWWSLTKPTSCGTPIAQTTRWAEHEVGRGRSQEGPGHGHAPTKLTAGTLRSVNGP